MTITSLDEIVNRCLLETGKPIHWYSEYLYNSATCLRELSFDTLQVINTKILTLNSYYAIDLPADYSDVVMVGVQAGGKIQPVPQTTGLNPLRNMDENLQYVPYSDSGTGEQGSGASGFTPGAMWFWNMNEWGEPVGRYYGAGGGAKANGYQVFKERGQIQLTETFTSPTAVLMYVSDGQSVDNATQIETKAFSTISAYISWKTSPNRNNEYSPEGRMFSNARRRLRARMNSLTGVDVVNIIRKNQIASPKS